MTQFKSGDIVEVFDSQSRTYDNGDVGVIHMCSDGKFTFGCFTAHPAGDELHVNGVGRTIFKLRKADPLLDAEANEFYDAEVWRDEDYWIDYAYVRELDAFLLWSGEAGVWVRSGMQVDDIASELSDARWLKKTHKCKIRKNKVGIR